MFLGAASNEQVVFSGLQGLPVPEAPVVSTASPIGQRAFWLAEPADRLDDHRPSERLQPGPFHVLRFRLDCSFTLPISSTVPLG